MSVQFGYTDTGALAHIFDPEDDSPRKIAYCKKEIGGSLHDTTRATICKRCGARADEAVPGWQNQLSNGSVGTGDYRTLVLEDKFCAYTSTLPGKLAEAMKRHPNSFIIPGRHRGYLTQEEIDAALAGRRSS
jgi:hypothetical protein